MADDDPRIASKVTEIVEFERGKQSQTINLLNLLKDFPAAAKNGSTGYQSIVSAIALFERLQAFDHDLTTQSPPTLAVVVQAYSTNPGLGPAFQALNKNFPAPKVVAKLRKNNVIKQCEDRSKMDLASIFSFLTGIAGRWTRFWDDVIALTSHNDPSWSTYNTNRGVTQVVDSGGAFQLSTDKFQKQIDMLREAARQSEIHLAEELKLHTCVRGFTITGSIENAGRLNTIMYLFEDKLALLQDGRTLKIESVPNLWFLNSPIYGRNHKVVDILGTKWSFAFEPETPAENEEMWKTWKMLSPGQPKDFGVFRPVQLSADPKYLNWVEVIE
jgi:hypothetical protein